MKKVAKAILLLNNKVLLQLRDNNPKIPFPNQWSLFGGMIEEKEKPEQCISREILEELNTPINNLVFITKQTRLENNILVEDWIFSAEISNSFSKLQLNEGAKMQLFSLEKLDTINIVPHYKIHIYNLMKKTNN